MHIMCIWSCFIFMTPKWPFWPLRWPRPNLRWTSLNPKQNLQSIYMHIMCIWPCLRFLTSKWPFLTPKMTSDDLEMHIIRIRMKFGIDWYAYQVHFAIFPIFDPKMTFFDPSDDLGWPQDAHHWIQKKISNRSICILCLFDMIFKYSSFYDL